MAMPRKPNHLKLLQGTFRPDRAGPEHVNMPSLTEVPEPPDWLPNALATKEWRRLAPILVEFKLLPAASIGPFGVYCGLHGKITQLFGAGETPSGHLISQYHQLASAFGLTAISQQKIKPRSTDPADVNPFSQIQGKKKR
jgi:phage terminase small subunit